MAERDLNWELDVHLYLRLRADGLGEEPCNLCFVFERLTGGRVFDVDDELGFERLAADHEALWPWVEHGEGSVQRPMVASEVEVRERQVPSELPLSLNLWSAAK